MTVGHDQPDGASDAQAMWQRRLRILGAVLMAWGVVHFIGSPALSWSWGAILLIAGAGQFVFTEPSLFVVYAVTLAWAALSNLLTGQALGIVNAAVQLFLSFSALRNYRAGRRAQAGPDAAPEAGRAARVFPWASLVLGVASVAGSLALLLAGYLVLGFTESAGLSRGYEALFQGVADLGALGMGTGAAALVSGYPRRGLAALGTAAGALVLAGQVVSGVLYLLFS